MANYTNTPANSGFATAWFSNANNQKYYDLYNFTAVSSCSIATCGGHSLNETASWYGNTATFLTSEKAWMIRGGGYNYSNKAGVFHFSNTNGGAGNHSFRSVLVKE